MDTVYESKDRQGAQGVSKAFIGAAAAFQPYYQPHAIESQAVDEKDQGNERTTHPYSRQRLNRAISFFPPGQLGFQV
jgi:hypothetical protein